MLLKTAASTLVGIALALSSTARAADVASPATATAPPGTVGKPPLDLKLKPERMQELVAQVLAESKSEEDPSIERIEVRGQTYDPNAPPDIPDGLGSVFWSIRHPTQAWRIFLPKPPRGRNQDDK